LFQEATFFEIQLFPTFSEYLSTRAFEYCIGIRFVNFLPKGKNEIGREGREVWRISN